MSLSIEHLTMSGLRLSWGGEAVCIDSPVVRTDPTVVTWSEAERIAGLGRARVVALPAILTWLDRSGIALDLDAPVAVGPLTISAIAYRPIPYATAPEALRKTLIGLRRPSLAARRLLHTLRRPPAPPVALRVEWAGLSVALCQQALHRFVTDEEAARLREFFDGCTVAVASPDYEDEEACGRLLGTLGADHHVLTDSIGPVRRNLGLPTRPLATSLQWAPPGTWLLEEGEHLRLELEHRATTAA